MMEGLVNGFPVKLLLMGFPISEFLALGFALPEIGADDDLFEGTAMDSKPEISKGRQRVQERKEKKKRKIANDYGEEDWTDLAKNVLRARIGFLKVGYNG